MLNRLTRQRDDLTAKIETSEARVAEIDGLFCRPGYFEATPPNEVAALQEERAALQERTNALMDEWAAVEREIEAL